MAEVNEIVGLTPDNVTLNLDGWLTPLPADSFALVHEPEGLYVQLVPEPVSLAFLGLGGLMMVMLEQHRRADSRVSCRRGA